MTATTSSFHRPTGPTWWQRLRGRAAPRRSATCGELSEFASVGIEAVLQFEEETRAIAAARDAADRRSHDTETRSPL